MEKSLEDRIKEAIRLQVEEPAPTTAPRRITITVPQDVFMNVEDLAKGIGESWSFTASLLLREAADYGLRAFAELGWRVRDLDGVSPNEAKELLLNPEMADRDPAKYAQARRMQAVGMLLPEVPPEDPSSVLEMVKSIVPNWDELSAKRQRVIMARVKRGEMWGHFATRALERES